MITLMIDGGIEAGEREEAGGQEEVCHSKSSHFSSCAHYQQPSLPSFSLLASPPFPMPENVLPSLPSPVQPGVTVGRGREGR